MKKILFYWLPVLLYCGLIYILSSFQLQGIPLGSFFDKIFHFGAYAILGALLLRAFLTTRLGTQGGKVIFLSIFLASLYGAGDEFHQYFVSFRSAEILDAVADIIGSVFGVLGYACRGRIFQREAPEIPALTKMTACDKNQSG